MWFRVPCKKQGGIRFTINGNKYFNLISVYNVAGAGDVKAVFVKGNTLKWTPLTRNWGQIWSTNCDLTNQELTFRVVNSDHRKSTSWHVTPRNWQFGQTFEGKNFRVWIFSGLKRWLKLHEEFWVLSCIYKIWVSLLWSVFG